MYFLTAVAFAGFQLLLSSLTTAHPTEQQLIRPAATSGLSIVRTKLKQAGIIPTVIKDMKPTLVLSVSWGNKTARLGNTIDPKYLQEAPTIRLLRPSSLGTKTTKNMKYILTLTDPDAPSRNDPKWSEFCHWIAANVTLEDPTQKDSIQSSPILGTAAPSFEIQNSPDDVFEYTPPSPPEKTGWHRYVFLVWEPLNGTTEVLHLSKPAERKRWGYEEGDGRVGVSKWAAENGLRALGANFIYAENEVQ